MPFDTANFIEYQKQEEEARIAQMIPAGTYNWEVESAEVTEVGGTPRLRVLHRLDASNTGKQIGRLHSEFFNWYANKDSDSDTPVEIRERNLRGLTRRKLYGYMTALSDSPTSTQEQGEHFEECIIGLREAKSVDEVETMLDAIGLLLEGQYITGRIGHSGTWTNFYGEEFDPTIGAAMSVTV